MCALMGSFDPEYLKQLRDLNAHRGEVSGSLAAISPISYDIQRKTGKLEDKDFARLGEQDDVTYFLGHIQAPTSDERANSTIHPASLHDDDRCRSVWLWHNGIIKQKEIDRLNKQLGTDYKWDTELLLALIDREGYAALSTVEGSFSCVALYYIWLPENPIQCVTSLHIFRNEISPLFIDDNFNISSTKFEGSQPTDAGVVYEFDIYRRQLHKTHHTFRTAENPYFFG